MRIYERNSWSLGEYKHHFSRSPIMISQIHHVRLFPPFMVTEEMCVIECVCGCVYGKVLDMRDCACVAAPPRVLEY